MTTMKPTLAAAAAALGLLAGAVPAAEGPAAARAATPTLPYTPGLDPAAMDRTVDACTDFYQYACGGWKANNPIPPDQTSWSVYAKLAQDNLVLLRSILEQAAQPGAQRDAVSRQIGDYYAACMDEAAVNARGAQPLASDLAAIAALRSTRALGPLLTRLQQQSHGKAVLFGVGSQLDPDDARKQIGGFDQAGLGLPDRDYYFQDGEKAAQIRTQYVAHLARMLQLLGQPADAAAKNAADVMRLETALAKASQTKVERRDPYATTHKMTLAQFQALVPELDWRGWQAGLQPARLASNATVNVAAPGFFKSLSAALRSEPLAVWQHYLRVHLADQRASTLSKPFVDESFAFYRQQLRGAKEDMPRWKRCVRLVDEQLGEALGQAFVREVFQPGTKAATLDMVKRIEAVMERRIQTLDWMSDPTKQAALLKLKAVRNKIGYPEKWRDYGAIRITRADFAGNVQRAAGFEFMRQLKKVGRPVDLGEWGMTPPTVNAYFDPQMNDINFPAGVLQPPLYDPKMDAAPNYGNTGGTIAHELTHGFDDEGRQFDHKGNLKDWWTKEDAARFAERAKCISDQYSQYEVVDGLKVNGALTLGEDVADLGGQVLAYEAWKDAVKGMELPVRDGLTPDQRFFVGFAQWSCSNMRPEQEREQVLTDPHSPPRYRVNGVVVNMPEFARAFQCRPGAPMTKPAGQACRIW
jgi:endothelin-converting enzyme/putative endopeptidase